MASMTPTATMDPGMPTARPTGITILAVLYGIGGAIAILGGIMMFAAGGVIGSMMDDAFGPLGAMIGGALGLVLVILGAVGLLVAWGIWTRKTWGWWIVGILAVIGLVSALLSLVQGEFSSIISIAIDIFLIWYLTAPGVQRWFGLSVKVPWHKTA